MLWEVFVFACYREKIVALWAYYLLVIGSLLLAWRAWKFSLLPSLRPNEPEEYPYWIPVVGHLKAFVANPPELLTRARLYFGNTREPFALTMGNKRFYIITKPDDVRVVFRNSSTLTFEIFAQEILRDLGCSNTALEAMYCTRQQGAKSLSRLARDFHIHQLHPGNLLNDIGTTFLNYYRSTLSIEYLAAQTKYATRTAPNSVTVSLATFFTDISTNAAQEAYFGTLIRKIEPNMTWILLDFNKLAWQLLFRYPHMLSRKMRLAKDKVIEPLVRYFACPQEERTDTVWFTKALETEMRGAGLDDRNIAIMFMTIYWGVVTNTRKAGFWLTAYILYNPELKAAIINEITPAFEGEDVNQEYIFSQCRRFQGAWEETLRMTAFSSSVRYIKEDTTVGSKLLRAGHVIMMPYREMHIDQSVFGNSVHEFAGERFLEDPGLRRFNMAFGGGATQCPGRHLATHTIMVFVAMLLHTFDVSLDDPDQQFPLADEAVPVMGIVEIKNSHDIKLRLRLNCASIE